MTDAEPVNVNPDDFQPREAMSVRIVNTAKCGCQFDGKLRPLRYCVQYVDRMRAVVDAAIQLRRCFPSNSVSEVVLDPMPCIDLANAVDALARHEEPYDG